MASSAKGRKGKVGKNKHRIAAYYNSGRAYVNKARKIVRHINRYGCGDVPAATAYDKAITAMPMGVARQFTKQYSI